MGEAYWVGGSGGRERANNALTVVKLHYKEVVICSILFALCWFTD